MTIIFAVVGGAAVVGGIASSDSHSDYSNYSDYDDYSNYSDVAVRRERRLNEINKNINSERKEAEVYINNELRNYLKNTDYSNKTASQILETDYNKLDINVQERIKQSFENKANQEKSKIQEEINEIDNILNILDEINIENKSK